MKNTNKIRLLRVIEKDNPPRTDIDAGATLPVCGKDLYGTEESYVEVWFSPTGFGAKDDVCSVGFMCIPYCLQFNEHFNKKYKLSVVSTGITKQFTDDWNKVIELPLAQIEHQISINEGLIFKL